MRPDALPLAPDWRGAFTPGLLDARRAAPPGVRAHAGKGVVRRYNVYRNNVMASLVAALAAIYPAVQSIVGNECFGVLAREYIRATPPSSPLLFEYGRGFAAFIAAHQVGRAQPVLADVARIERAWLDAYHAADAPVLGAEALAAVEPAALARLRLRAHPAARIVRSRHAALDWFTHHRAPGEACMPTPGGAAQDTLITRPGQEVIASRLPAGGAVFLAALIGGAALGEAAEAAWADEPAFDLELNLAGLLSAGVFTGIQGELIGDESQMSGFAPSPSGRGLGWGPAAPTPWSQQDAGAPAPIPSFPQRWKESETACLARKENRSCAP